LLLSVDLIEMDRKEKDTYGTVYVIVAGQLK